MRQLRHLFGTAGLRRLNGTSADGEANRTEATTSVGDRDEMEALEELPVYRNVTGLLRGTWVRSAASRGHDPRQVNLTSLGAEHASTSLDFLGNITGTSGDVQVKLKDKSSDEVFEGPDGATWQIRGVMTIRDGTSPTDGWDVDLHGIHFPHLGQAVLTTTSDKFAGLFVLPHFLLSPYTFALSQRLLNNSLTTTMSKQESAARQTLVGPWSSSPASFSNALSQPHCEYVVYLQQHAVALPGTEPRTVSSLLRLIEDELRFPTGAPRPTAPSMTMSMTVFSPDCGFILESQGPPDFPPAEGLHLLGEKVEPYLCAVKGLALAFGLVCGGQVVLLVRQMAQASTPSTVSRISLPTIGMMAMGDGVAFVSLLTLSIFVDAASLALTTTAFLAFICVNFFGMRFMMDIWTVQAPERIAREMRTDAGSSAAALTTPGELPAPVTASPVILPPDQDLAAAEAEDAAGMGPAGNNRRELGALYSRFIIVLLVITFTSLNATSWPRGLRSAYVQALSLVYFSFWIPQIHRNIMRNTRKAFTWDFVVGQSVLRLLPFLYLYTFPDHVLFVKPDGVSALVLVGWVWLQVWLLGCQAFAGPRCFTPRGWAPPAYDYHPVLKADDAESGLLMSMGSSQMSSDASGTDATAGIRGGTRKERGTRLFDCAICTEQIEVPVVAAGDQGHDTTTTGLAGAMLRRKYMVTPCQHLYHSHCLEGWLRYRLQCPVCRSPCPPI
ncbi:MAG: hypothetical protein M1838_003480 [Thelocarpon superellum]|nr:MAG: hypothetical protein M1838_003480 [Thelocarpon superellum]